MYGKRRGDSIDFIGRITCLFVPIGIRIYITGLLVGILALVLAVFVFGLPFSVIRPSLNEVKYVLPMIVTVVGLVWVRKCLLYISGAEALSEDGEKRK